MHFEIRLLYKLNQVLKCKTNTLCTSVSVDKIRNIGILAHIDAGKTTTTERMLYYSGVIRQMGEVHHGNTVTDYMDQERERGITITSAAVTFYWNKYRFNLLDTPGHIDFTMEVEQTLNVLDGAVVILDSSAGVEAQTMTVWKQADKYNIPRIVYLNKMDRLDADMEMCCKSIQSKFNIPTVKMQIPIVNNNRLIGIVDVLTLEKLLWTKEIFTKSKLSESSDEELWNKSKVFRNDVIDQLSSVDDNLANIIIEKESLEAVDNEHIASAVKRATINKRIVPVFCGSSYKNIGVQPLMDAIISYLPSPKELLINRQFNKCFTNHLAAKAFKVMHDRQRGPLVFFRLYSGSLTKAQKVYNVRKKATEQCGKIMNAYADEFNETNEAISEGNIAVVSGLKDVASGDLITNSASSLEKAKGVSEKLNLNILDSVGRIPEPVFFCSIEPPSLAFQVALDAALAEISREDPSLRVSHNEQTGQTVLAGMGELHLEIIRDRILKEYKIEADLGTLQITYREMFTKRMRTCHVSDLKIGNVKQYVKVDLSLLPDCQDEEILLLDKSPEAAETLSHITFKVLSAVRQGVQVGLGHGPKIAAQVVNASVLLHSLEVGRGTSNTIITSTVTQSIRSMLDDCETRILEPIMLLEIIIPEEYSSVIMSDLSQRRATIRNVENRGSNKVISSETPLSELLGYSNKIRTLSSGTATFSMEFLEYQAMSSIHETKAISIVRGF